MLWRRLRYAFRWLVRSDTNGNDPAKSPSFHEWMNGWKPGVPHVVVGADNRRYYLRDLMKQAWLAAQGRSKFKGEG